MNRFLIIKTHKKLWRLDYKIYALGTRLALPRPLPVKLASYFGVAALFMLLVNKLPFMGMVPFAIKAALTFGMAALLNTVKLDGKNPIVYFGGCLRFLLFERGVHREHFKECVSDKPLSLKWRTGNQCWTQGRTSKAVKVRWTGGMRGGNVFV